MLGELYPISPEASAPTLSCKQAQCPSFGRTVKKRFVQNPHHCGHAINAHYTAMINRPKRNEAASLIARFATGEINSEDLESEWPTCKKDRALEAIGSMLWLHYDDHKPRRMIDNEAASSDELLLFGRYQAYLRSDLPYEWPEDDFIRIEGLGALVPLSFGLLRPIDRIIKSRNAKVDAAMKAHGDLTVWPFTSRAQWGGEPKAPYVS